MDWKSVCCAVQGKGHKKDNVPCQDKTACREEDSVQVIALADGAGSAAFSHYGAECVVNRVTAFIADKFFDLVEENDGRKVKQEILTIILRALKDEAEFRECNLKDLASTLLVAAVSEENFFLFHLGDGVIGYLNDEGLKTASVPDNGEFSNETIFTTSENAIAHIRIYKGALRNISGFVLMSDGTEQSLYNKKNKTLATVVKSLLHRTCLIDSEILKVQLEEAFNSVVIDNTQDDCSIAMLAKISKQLPKLEDLSLKERQNFFQINDKLNFKKTHREILVRDKLCNLLKNPMTLRQISRKLYLKPKHIRKKLKTLLDTGLVVQNEGKYSTYSNN